MKSSGLRNVAIFVVAVLWLFCARPVHSQDCVELKLRRPTFGYSQNTADGIHYKVDRIYGGERGGTFDFHLIGQDRCKGRAQRFWLAWTFDRDVSALRVVKSDKSLLFNVLFDLKGDRDDCINGNPSIGPHEYSNLMWWKPDSTSHVFPHPDDVSRSHAYFLRLAMENGFQRGFKFQIPLPSLPNRGGDSHYVTYDYDVVIVPCGAGPTVIQPPPASCPESLSCGICLGSGLRQKWLSMGGEQGRLGCPWGPEAEAARSPQGTSGRFTQTRGGEGGYLIWAANGSRARQTFVVEGCMFKLYQSIGGTSSRLGFPLSDAYNVAGGVRQDFEGGSIFWSAATRQCAIAATTAPAPGCTEPLSCGFCLGSGIRQKWLLAGGESGRMGCPVSSEADTARSIFGTAGRFSQFRGGDGAYILWAGNGVNAGRSFVVEGCMFKLYHDSGGTSSRLGFPLGDAYTAPGGIRQDFEGGYVFWSSATRQCTAQMLYVR